MQKTQNWYTLKDIKLFDRIPEGTRQDSYLLRIRSSHPRCSVRKAVLRNFTKFTGKHLRQSLFFNIVEASGLRLATLLNKRIWRRCFPVNFVKFLRTPLDDCRIEKKIAFFSGSNKIPQKNAILSQENM